MAQRILVVDDEPVIVDAAGKILRAEGFGVRTAGDAEGGLALLHSEPFDIALIDLMLPGISGMGLLHFIRGERAATRSL
jgi:DNA-binding response OmpR family regulator